MAMNDKIEHTALQEELRATSIFGQLRMHKLFDHAWTGKADETSWLGKDHIPQHGKAGGDATGCWIGQEAEVWKSCCAQPGQSGRGFCHLHQGVQSLLH